MAAAAAVQKVETPRAVDASPPRAQNRPSKSNQLGEIAIEASQIVSRLERVAEGLGAPPPPPPEPPRTVFLGLEQRHPDEIVQTIHGVICNEEDDEPTCLPPIDDTTRLVITAHSLSAYCAGLDRHVLRKLNARFTTDLTRWIGSLFGFIDAAAYYHDDHLEGLVRITRMALHYKFPRFLEDGALSYTSSLPMIYSSVASPLGVVQHLCRQLGLPLACIRPVPVNTHFGSQHTMDVSALQRLVSEDLASTRTPLMVIADVGTVITGHSDNILRIQTLCKTNDVWFHLRGHGLAALALQQHQLNSAQGGQTPISDSFTLTLGNWLGNPGLPAVTLYRQWDPASPDQMRSRQVGSRESTLPLIAGLKNDHHGRRVITLPLWTALQAMGAEGVHARVRDAFVAVERLWGAIDVYRHVRVLSQKPGGESGTYLAVSELISKPINIPLLFETTCSCVTFQFTPEIEDGEHLGKVPPYYDKLNSWLGQILQLDAPQVPLDICELENVGVVLRFCPFELTNCQLPTFDAIQSFVQCLEQQLIILRATVQHKETFVKLVEASPVLKLVELPEWAGLGGVRYAPEGWEQLLTEQVKDELNNLNMALVDTLRSTDSAFSLGEGSEGLMCVRFGMLTPQSDVEELLNLVAKVGQSVEENSRVLDSMAEIVRKGIETATLDLQKENEERLWQEGILRHVPVVGTFVNWWSPKTKETGVRGRSLNLTQGVVESTENIYKYHMQMQAGTSVPTGTKVPPTPQVQKPIGDGHSRSGSQASAASSGPPNSVKGEATSPKGEDEVQSNGVPQRPLTTRLQTDGTVLTR